MWPMTDPASRRIRQQPEFAALDDTTLAVRRLVSASQDLTVRTARGIGMNLTDMTAIMVLSEHGPLGVAELARRLGVSSPATTVLVDRLERAGHVRRVPHSTDRRRVDISDTASGRAATRQAWLPAIAQIDEVCRSLSEAEHRFARDLLERLTEAMVRSAAGGERSPAAGNHLPIDGS
jgi:DNA-binding MarR family transcriptional regulator